MHRYDFESEHIIEDFEECDDFEETELTVVQRVYNSIFPNGYEVYHLICDVFIAVSIVLIIL